MLRVLLWTFPPSSHCSVFPMLGNHANLCRWSDCRLLFPNAEQLYDHLCEDHVGRKITSNLCLACKWKDCSSSYTKRDHITSHLRGTCMTVMDCYNLLFLKTQSIPSRNRTAVQSVPAYRPQLFDLTYFPRHAGSLSSASRTQGNTKRSTPKNTVFIIHALKLLGSPTSPISVGFGTEMNTGARRKPLFPACLRVRCRHLPLVS